jgi:hypothetical protein
MREIALLGASALVLALGLASASAEPFNPVTGYSNSPYGARWSNPDLQQFHEAGGNGGNGGR